LPRFVDIGGCPVPTGHEFDRAVRYAVRRVGVNPTTVYRGSEPEALRIMHAHGKHSQGELHALWAAGRAGEFGIRGEPNREGTSTHELRSAGIFSASLTARIPAYQCGMDWPDAVVGRVIEAFGDLDMGAFRPYPSSFNERQHVCCRRPPRFTPAQRIYLDPVKRGDKGEVVRHVQILCKRAGNYRGRVARRTGTCGPILVRAIKATQRELGLKPDGVWAPTTNARAEKRWGRR
jgi:hypothetical protein